jgi:hypothetical protein
VHAYTTISAEFTISDPTAVQTDMRCMPVGDTKMHVNAPVLRLETGLGVLVSQSVPSVDRVNLRKRNRLQALACLNIDVIIEILMRFSVELV